MSEPAATPLIVSVPPKFPNWTCPEMSAAADGAPPSISTRSTSRPCFAKMPISFAKKGARFAGVTLPYDDLILMGSGASVAPEEGDGLGAVVAAPHAAKISDRTAIGASARENLRISRHLRAADAPAAAGKGYTTRPPPQITAN